LLHKEYELQRTQDPLFALTIDVYSLAPLIFWVLTPWHLPTSLHDANIIIILTAVKTSNLTLAPLFFGQEVSSRISAEKAADIDVYDTQFPYKIRKALELDLHFLCCSLSARLQNKLNHRVSEVRQVQLIVMHYSRGMGGPISS
jgi:hypothetical protein